MAWAVVESENNSSWTYFLHHLKVAIPTIDTVNCTVISARDKGLSTAADRMIPNTHKAHCCRQCTDSIWDGSEKDILRNCTCQNFGNNGRYVNCLSFKTFQSILTLILAVYTKLGEICPAAAAYLRATDQSKFTTVHFSGNRQGHDTSNIAGSMNTSLATIRELGIVPMLNAIWAKYMITRTARHDASLRLKVTQTLTPYSEELLRKSLDWRDRNRVEQGGPAGRQAEVTQLNGHVHVVDLDNRTCTCGDVNYKENGVPCGHTVSLLAALHERAINYMPSKLGRDNWGRYIPGKCSAS